MATFKSTEKSYEINFLRLKAPPPPPPLWIKINNDKWFEQQVNTELSAVLQRGRRTATRTQR